MDQGDDADPHAAAARADDSRLADGLRGGDPAAWLRLYDRHATPLWRHVSRLLGGDPHATADVVQATLLAAARSAAGYDPARGTPWMWLWGIGRRLAALHLRDRGRRERHAADVGRVRAWLDGGDDAPADVLEAKEVADLVRAVLADLPDDDAFVLVAAYADHQSMAEVAAALGKSVEATRSHAARARRAFRAAFARLAPDDRRPTHRRTEHVP